MGACIDEIYKHPLQDERKAEQLADVGLKGAPKMYVNQGNWKNAINSASELSSVVAKLNGGLQTYKRSRSTNFPVNFNIYERIGPDLFSAKTLNIMEACSTWDSLRDMCLGITDTVSEAKSPDASWDLSLLLISPHYYATNVVLTD